MLSLSLLTILRTGTKKINDVLMFTDHLHHFHL